MTPHNHIIVEVEAHTKNENKIGEITLVTGIKHLHLGDEATECGIVKAVPNGCTIPIGSKLYFHRNVTIHTNHEHTTAKSKFHIEDNLYLVPYSRNNNLTFGYVQDNDFVITGNYSLCKAEKEKGSEINGLIIQTKKGYEGFVEETATVTYPTPYAVGLVDKKCYLEPQRNYLLNMEGTTYWAVQDPYLMAYETP